ncbi:UvrD-helicase domain-containing protein [Sphaerochaeta sp.]|uniref:UvrD-helicase domain-containing protein n=1 Tax=Sphaerochaeta sp. TaxID=1972642 RepID=UPI002FCADA8D
MIGFDEVLSRTGTQLDENQRKAVFADTNCVVRAGAGSGKTTVLSYRFLRLVLEGKARFDQILTLTFTRKAAREMHQRIHRQLLLCKDDPDIAAQLASFSEASIATLDSFCATIVRTNCLAYGIAPDFVIDDEQTLQNIRLCAHDLLDADPMSEGARILSTLYAPEILVDEVLVDLANHAYPLGHAVPVDASLRIRDAVRAQYENLLQQFLSLLGEYAAFTEPTKGVQGAKEDAVLLLKSLEACRSDAQYLEVLGSSLAYRRRPGAGKGQEHQYLKETLDTYYSLRRSLSIALSVLTGLHQLEAVLSFVSSFIAAVHNQKRSCAILTFADVASLAVQMLSTDTTLRSFFKAKYRYIMIDEFQDNNAQQKNLLYLLAERRDRNQEGIPQPGDLERDKLFFVGDEKQSIYRFRGSDVRVFKQLGNELSEIGGECLELETNYRSEPDLIRWYNALFPTVMQNNGQSYEADFRTLGHRQAKEGVQSSCTLLIKPFQTNREEGEGEEARDVDAEAYAVASLIQKMLSTDDYLIPSKSGPRRPLSSDIALLLRSTSNQLSFEKAFRSFDIPYTVQTARSLMLEAPANDLYAMLQLALYPDDKHAYATVLRSPFCNLSDRILAEVLDCALFTAPSSLSAEDSQRLATCKAFYTSFVAQVGSASLSSLVDRMWYDSGYYLSLVAHPRYQVYTEHYTFLHRLAEMQQQMGKSVSQFLDFLRENLAQNEKIEDLTVIKEQEQGVQVMSIHKSKGLEFPIVVVANTGSKGRSGSSNLSECDGIITPHYLDATFFVSETKQEKARHAGQLFEQDQEASMDRAELKRLLYVALTRAETHLVVSGCFGRANRSLDGEGQAQTLLLMLTNALGIDPQEPVLGRGFPRLQIIEGISEQMLYGSAEQLRLSIEEQSWYEAECLDYDLRPIRYAVTALHPLEEQGLAPNLRLYQSDEILSRYADAQTAGFGTFVHSLCEEQVLGKEIPDPSAFLPEALASVLTKQELTVLVRDAMLLCRQLIDSAWYKKEILPYTKACEVAFLSAVEQEGRKVVAEGSIDVLVDRGDHLFVIDFKTDRRKEPEMHRFQVQTYMDAMFKIHRRKVLGCVLYLRDPEHPVVWEQGEYL